MADFSVGRHMAIAYDTLYALVDREFDIKMGMKSTAILFGSKDAIIVFGLHMTVIAILCLVGLIAHRGAAFYCALFAALFFALYQYYIARSKDPDNCFKAFLNNNYLGMTIFFGVVIDFTLFPG